MMHSFLCGATLIPTTTLRLQQLVDNGPFPQPGETGARFIIRDDGARHDLRYIKRDTNRNLEVWMGSA